MALVTPQFLASVAACTHNANGSLTDPSGATVYPTAAPSGGHSNPWTLGATGYTMPSGVYTSLIGATAQHDGSFVTINGSHYWLGLDASGTAVADLPSGPPPP